MMRPLLLLVLATTVIGSASVVLLMLRLSYSVDVVTPSRMRFESLGTLETQTTSEQDWPQWRGRDSDGVAKNGHPPHEWDSRKGIKWRTVLPGKGHSSPVLWGNRVFITSADDKLGTQSVLCVDFNSGELLWSRVATHGRLPAIHTKNTHASATPACDAEAVYCVFAIDDSIQVSAIRFDGTRKWLTNAGPYISQWGYGSSPVNAGSLLIVDGESRGSKLGRIKAISFLAAIEKDSGNIYWRVRRPEEHNYGTPIVARIAGHHQLLVCGSSEIHSYDALTGSSNWVCRSNTLRFANTPAFDDNHVFISGVYNHSEILSIEADGSGDVTDTHVSWRSARGACDVPSPIVYAGVLYVLQDSGVLTSFDSTSGRTMSKIRLGGAFSASPIIAGGCLFASNEEGRTYVLDLSDTKPQIVAQNALDEPIFATPTPVGDSLLIRTESSLLRVCDE